MDAYLAIAPNFLDCIVSGKTPINDGQAGLRVVKVLEAADRSLAERGTTVLVS